MVSSRVSWFTNWADKNSNIMTLGTIIIIMLL